MKEIKIGSSVYPVEERNGECYINNMSKEDFVKSLPYDELILLASLGKKIWEGEKIDNCQQYINELNQQKWN